jgi:predicted nucleic acid-binding protein
MPAKVFADSNVLLYLLSSDTAKADRAESVVRARPTVSVQVLNEITNVARRKLAMPWPEVDELVVTVQAHCPVEALTLETHEAGRRLAQRYSLSVYDAMIAASALAAECETLLSEDMQHGLLIEKRLRVVNPFTD